MNVIVKAKRCPSRI